MSTATGDNASTKLWRGAHYSGKALRTRAILLWCVTFMFAGIGYLVNSVISTKTEPASAIVWTTALLVPAGLWFWFLCIYFYRTWTIAYELDGMKLIYHSGLFWRRIDTMLIAQIDDMVVKQNLWDRFINGNVGTVVLLTTDKTHPEMRISGLENPKWIFESIDYHRQEYVKRRGYKSFRGALGDGGDGYDIGDMSDL